MSATDSATTWHVQAGNLDDLTFTSVAQEVTAFYNARTVVRPGDDVLFTPVGDHTVTFNPIRVPGVPNFAYESHVRHFADAGQVAARYGRFFRDFDVLTLKSPRSPRDEFFLFDGVRNDCSPG